MTERGAKRESRYTAVIMAGTRGGSELIAAGAGVSHKCLVEVDGRAMLLRVLETLESSPWVGHIVLCVESGFEAPPFVARRLSEGSLQRLEAAGSPAASAGRACAELGGALPLLIVTGDHPLLSADMLAHFCKDAIGAGDVAVGVARAALVQARYPESTRTLLRFSDGPYCGCNMFALNTPAAARATAFWIRLESDRKRPWRLVRMLGVRALAAYLGGRLTLAAAMDEISRKLDLEANAIEMPFAEAAIDVDKPADLVLVQSILERARADGGSD